jgi:hypothetical protein
VSDQKNFEPFLDWGAITPEMAADLHENIVEFRRAQDLFLQDPTPEHAGAVLKPQFELTKIANAIHETIFTIPVMVHSAGQKTRETTDDDKESITQRCKRCGSILQRWVEGFAVMTPGGPVELDESNLPWWDEDDRVAKATGDGGMAMYEIEKNRELNKYELLCVDLAGMLPSES